MPKADVPRSGAEPVAPARADTGGAPLTPQPRRVGGRWWQFALIGLAAGFLSATLGIGGGVVIVPMLMLWFGLPAAVAVAVSVGSIVVSSGTVVAFESIRDAVLDLDTGIRWDFCTWLLLGSLPGVFCGQRLRTRLPERGMAWAFGIVLLLAALKLAGAFTIFGAEHNGVLDSWLAASAFAPSSATSLAAHGVATVLLGFLGGLAAPLFGLGGGIIFVPGLAILFAEFAAVQDARTTSLGTVFFSTVYAAYLQWKAGSMRFDLLRLVLPGTLAGTAAGIAAADHLGNDVLRFLIAGFIAYCAVRMILNARRQAP